MLKRKEIVIVSTGGPTDKEFRGLWCPDPVPENLVAIAVEYHDCPEIEQAKVDPSVGETIAQLVVELFSEGIDQAIQHQLHKHDTGTFPSEGEVRERLLSHLGIRWLCSGDHSNCWQSALIDAGRSAFSHGLQLARVDEVAFLGAGFATRCARGLCLAN